MKKIYLVLIMLLAVFGLSQSGWAQATIADGLIKVSDDTNEYWYYIENGHAHDGPRINDKDGRFCTLISESTNTSTLGSIRTDLVKPTDQRATQKWKVVASETTGYYHLINQKGNYFNAISGTRGSKVSPTVGVTSGTCDIAISLANNNVATSGLYVKMQAKDIANYIGASNTGNGSGIEYGGTPPAVDATKGIHASPRSWRFIPEEDIDTYYPEIYEAATTSDKIYKWYYIKSLDAAISGDAKYMTTSGLAAKENAQLFGFVYDGYSSSGTHNSTTDLTKIISKTTGETVTIGDVSKWAMRHYYSASYNAEEDAWTPEIQVLFRTDKNEGNAFDNTLSLVSAKNATANDIFNSAYNWTFEIASFSVAVNGGTNVDIITSNIPTTVESGTELEIKYKVGPASPDGFTYLPVVTVNGGAPLPATLPDDNGIYTLSLIVADNTTISIAAEQAQNVITFDLTGVKNNSVTINSPELEDNKFTTGNVLTVEYSLTEGYTEPTIMPNDANVTVGTPTLRDGKYIVAISGISKATTLTFANAVITYNVILPANGDGIIVGTNAVKADYFNDYVFTFTMDNGYNHPQVYANGIYVSPAKNEDGSYSATISDIREDLVITARAFELAENVLPVAADTYITGTAYTDYSGVNYSAGDVLWIQGSKGSYNRISYLEFDLSAFGEAQYNVAYLKLIYKERQDKKYEDPIFHVRTVPAEMPALNVVTWNNSGEADGLTRKGDVVSNSVTFARGSEAGTVLELDVTTYILDNLGASNTIRLAATSIATTEDSADPESGYFAFYSLEGALAANNIDYIPVLVLEKSETLTWEGFSSEWEKESNWEENIVPRKFDNVIISANTTTPVLPENTTIANLVIKEGAEIDLNGKTLAVTGKVSIEKTAAIDSDGYWMSIGFPFEVSAHSSYYDSKGWGSQLYPHGYSFSDYWLKYYDNDEFKYYSTNEFLAANKGYNALFPNAFNSFRAIEFRGNNVTIAAPQQLDITKDGSYQLVANPTLAKYPIEDNTPENYYYYKYDSNNNNYKRITDEGAEIEAFEAFIVVYNEDIENYPLRSIIIGNEENDFTNIDNVRDDLDIVIATKYYNLQGVEISKPADAGVYIVKKTLQSGKEVTEKVINTNR